MTERTAGSSSVCGGGCRDRDWLVRAVAEALATHVADPRRGCGAATAAFDINDIKSLAPSSDSLFGTLDVLVGGGHAPVVAVLLAVASKGRRAHRCPQRARIPDPATLSPAKHPFLGDRTKGPSWRSWTPSRRRTHGRRPPVVAVLLEPATGKGRRTHRCPQREQSLPPQTWAHRSPDCLSKRPAPGVSWRSARARSQQQPVAAIRASWGGTSSSRRAASCSRGARPPG
jgi:hypothetical protein